MLMTVSLTASRAPADMPSRMAWEPRLEVMMRMVFLKDTVRPWLSVTPPIVQDLHHTSLGCQ